MAKESKKQFAVHYFTFLIRKYYNIHLIVYI